MQRNIILCVGLTPAWQEVMEFNAFRPGEVNRAVRRTCCAAGKGPNVARALQTLGGAPLLLTFAGGHTGRPFAADLQRAGVQACLIPDPAPTRLCVTLLDRSTGTVTELVNEAALPPPRSWRAFFAAYRRLLPRTRLVVIAGAPMPGAAPDLYARLAAEASQTNTPVLLDTRNQPLLNALPHRPLVAKLNADELCTTLGHKKCSDTVILAGARQLLAAGAQNVVITSGRRGALLVTARTARWFMPPAVEVVNSVGCGDAMAAGMAWALAEGKSLEQAVRLGAACGTASALTDLPASFDPAAARQIIRKITSRRL